MSRICLFIFALTTVFSFVVPETLFSQTTDEEVTVFQEPTDFPGYILVPRGEVDPYGKSTLNTTTLGARTGVSSNLEINQPVGRTRAEEPEGTVMVETLPEDQRSIEFAPLPERTRDRFYTWVDGDGVIHVTNDIDSVPPGYRR